ncbi:TetR/AcrR family transcriptional regulator [Brachybacterium sp. AOP25-B2-12]|uniref:TetR/AcrR family transcriptional regulator n=1 Tax=Brachybacterium sp. AOP25-B2-12 TaxID=3457710 RepID=UPI004034355C
MSTIDRTRQAILDAAVRAFGEDPRAPLAEIAASAGVGRTTLHRYFADRAGLVAAVDDLARARFAVAAEAARLQDGTGWEAIARMTTEFFDLGELLALIFVDSPVIDPDTWGEEGTDPGFSAAVARGHRDGTIDPVLDAAWCESTVWMLLFAACQALATGMGRADARALLLRTVRGALGPKAD